jgi:DNA-binding response OmpR family regulator
MAINILLVEDDESLGYIIQDSIEENTNYQVTRALNGKQATELFQAQTFELIILDVMLPIIDGFTLAETFKAKKPDQAIIFLTSKSLNEDRIRGLKLGADDYITKPFNFEELQLRILAIIKRIGITSKEGPVTLGTYTHDQTNLCLLHSSGNTQLTQRESELLKMLIISKNQTLQRDQILIALWGSNDYFKGRSLDVFITKLRKYLSADPLIRISNVHGVGFKLEYLG